MKQLQLAQGIDPALNVLGLTSQYDLNDREKYEIKCHHQPANEGEGVVNYGGYGNERPHQLLNPLKQAGTKLYTQVRASNELVGWVSLKWAEPMELKGFGLMSANDMKQRDPKDVRIYAKI